MKFCKSVLAMFLILLLLPLTVSAAGSVDPDHATSVAIQAKFDKMSMTGMTFSLYRVSSMEETGELTVRQPFAPYAADLDIRGKNDEAWKKMAQTLERWVVLNPDIQPTAEAVVKENGLARLSDLPMGLYLVVAEGLEREGYIYTSAPFFLVLPEQVKQTNTWNYDLTANAKPEKNPVRMDYEVIKIWKDSCHIQQRPQSITIQLMRDGEPYGEAVTLPEDGHWSHTWHDLDVNHKWTVTEEKQEGYKEPDIQQEGNTFLVTNTCSKGGNTPGNPGSGTGGGGKLPQTGQLWWPVPLLLTAGLLCIAIGLIRRRGARNEA